MWSPHIAGVDNNLLSVSPPASTERRDQRGNTSLMVESIKYGVEENELFI
jgi:hypothetical protein